MMPYSGPESGPEHCNIVAVCCLLGCHTSRSTSRCSILSYVLYVSLCWAEVCWNEDAVFERERQFRCLADGLFPLFRFSRRLPNLQTALQGRVTPDLQNLIQSPDIRMCHQHQLPVSRLVCPDLVLYPPPIRIQQSWDRVVSCSQLIMPDLIDGLRAWSNLRPVLNTWNVKVGGAKDFASLTLQARSGVLKKFFPFGVTAQSFSALCPVGQALECVEVHEVPQRAVSRLCCPVE
mmetsp:Transcript_28883/g.56550  ORF Transcript_28883/g.56550 Transcript_28883/m.56550 type:complete len:234 (+) Transcript_28883:9-710(+)